MLRNLLAGVVAIGLATSPAAAAAPTHPAAKLSIAKSVPSGVRAGPATHKSRKAIGGGFLIALALAAVVGIVVAAGGSESPDSP